MKAISWHKAFSRPLHNHNLKGVNCWTSQRGDIYIDMTAGHHVPSAQNCPVPCCFGALSGHRPDWSGWHFKTPFQNLWLGFMQTTTAVHKNPHLFPANVFLVGKRSRSPQPANLLDSDCSSWGVTSAWLENRLVRSRTHHWLHKAYEARQCHHHTSIF